MSRSKDLRKSKKNAAKTLQKYYIEKIMICVFFEKINLALFLSITFSLFTNYHIQKSS